jgi:hypothetical protein
MNRFVSEYFDIRGEQEKQKARGNEKGTKKTKKKEHTHK